MPFFSLPAELSNPQKSRHQVVPIPYEGTVCFLKGTAKGPDAILAVSDQMEYFDEETLTDISRFGIATLPPIPPADTPEEEFNRIYETVKEYGFYAAETAVKRKFPIFLGGEHSITPPLVKVAAEHFGQTLSVLQFDAHADLRNSYTGGKYSHASAMRRVLDYTPNLVQVGIRSFSEEEFRECPDRIKKIITPKQLASHLEHSIGNIRSGLTENVYITFDIDAFDPAFAPGTGTPEPGGLDWNTVCCILRTVCKEKNVVGADVVEVAPLGGNNVITEFLAARLVEKIIAYTSCG
ncbi:MAG: agmatinase [Planctomycetaceae bacterium]|jgi:agmatinase|nr:agmatinase [Planctomycetaceae bacterium]